MQLNPSTSARRWIALVVVVVVIGAIAALLLWFWFHREGQSSRNLDKVTIAGFDKSAQKEFGSNGSGDFPPSATAYFIGPPGDAVITAPGFTVTRVDRSNDLPETKGTVIYLGEGPPNCSLDVDRLDPTAQLPSWANLSAKQRSAFETGSAQVLEVGMMCRG